MATLFSRSNPSPRYQQLLTMYQDMHLHGETFLHIPPEQTFGGQSLFRHASQIKKLIDTHQARRMLDYGAGKGQQYSQVTLTLPDGRKFPSVLDYWGVESVTCYDPGYRPFSTLPTGTFDGVICTDVLEHCPEDDVDWILREIFGYAFKFVFANVACYPAKKRLPNGENAHCTIRTLPWWTEKLKAVATGHPGIRYEFLFDSPEEKSAGGKLCQWTVEG